MKKFTVKATALAIASVCGSVAFAGSVSAPVTPTAFAVEALKADGTTAVTLPAYTYKMGVGRPAGNGFTIIVNPSAGSTFPASGTVCVVPTFTGAAAVAVTVKRQAPTECAYDVQVPVAPGADVAVNDTFTWTGQTFATTPLATAGSNVSVNITLKDPGETAYVDQSGYVTGVLATSGRALTLTAAADTGTKTNVNDAAGPLYGFIVQNDDTAYVAKASFVVGNNNGATRYVLPNGVGFWDFTVDGTKIDVTVAGNFSGLAANGYVVTTDGPTPAVAGEVATAAGATATFTLLPANVKATGVGVLGDTTVTSAFTATGLESLGTSRVFGVSGVGTSATVGAATDTLSGNASWWTWSANAIQLSSPYMSTDAGTGVLTRFFFQNLGPAATYTAACQAETGKTVTAGAAAAGSLNAGQTVIDAKDVCSFSSGIRGSVTFTINAPAANIKGAYNLGLNGAASAFIPLERPYLGSTY